MTIVESFIWTLRVELLLFGMGAEVFKEARALMEVKGEQGGHSSKGVGEEGDGGLGRGEKREFLHFLR